MNRRNLLALGLSSAVLAACSSDPVPRDAYYRLGTPTAQARAGGPIRGVLEVPPLRASGIVNERAILYRDTPQQLMQYSYSAWIEPPAVMVQRSLIDALRQAQAFETIVSPVMRMDRDFELVGDLRQWEHVRGDNSVAIEMEVSIRRVRGNQQLLLKTYRTSEPAAGSDMTGVADAFTRGLNTIYKDLIADLAAVKP
jgi:ABC-type uncharacterized transport system auxiliary subunit